MRHAECYAALHANFVRMRPPKKVMCVNLETHTQLLSAQLYAREFRDVRIEDENRAQPRLEGLRVFQDHSIRKYSVEGG